MSQKEKILVVRTDKLGDVLLSLPALEYLRQVLPDVEIHFQVQSQHLGVIEAFLRERTIGVSPVSDCGLRELSAAFQRQAYAAAILLYADARTYFATKRARIPLRIGNYSKPASFLALTHGIRQRRSLAKFTEAQYGLQLVQLATQQILGDSPQIAPTPVCLPRQDENMKRAKEALSGIRATPPFVVLHPGMGGSAVNLSADRYSRMIDALEKIANGSIILSIGPSPEDQLMGNKILEQHRALRVLKGLPLAVLTEVFRMADLVIAPSTGPLHLAHCVGTATFGLFSPVRSQHALRWRPWGGSGKSTALWPSVRCPQTRRCAGERCQYHPCMDNFNWENELAQVMPTW